MEAGFSQIQSHINFATTGYIVYTISKSKASFLSGSHRLLGHVGNWVNWIIWFIFSKVANVDSKEDSQEDSYVNIRLSRLLMNFIQMLLVFWKNKFLSEHVLKKKVHESSWVCEQFEFVIPIKRKKCLEYIACCYYTSLV